MLRENKVKIKVIETRINGNYEETLEKLQGRLGEGTKELPEWGKSRGNIGS